MSHLNPLPFQFELEDISNQLTLLRDKVNPDSDLGEALDRVLAILEPYHGNVEWQVPIDIDECEFRAVMRGMKL